MRLTAILAVSRDGAIGDTRSSSGMPWPRLARDMRRFRDATMGKVVLVGRKTYDTLPTTGLPGRRIAVVTRNAAWSAGHPHGHPLCVRALGSINGVIHILRLEDEVMVIGGAEVYRRLLPVCDRILLTVVEADYPDADVRLERPEALTEGWLPLARETYQPDESNPVRVTFSEWGRPLHPYPAARQPPAGLGGLDAAVPGLDLAGLNEPPGALGVDPAEHGELGGGDRSPGLDALPSERCRDDQGKAVRDAVRAEVPHIHIPGQPPGQGGRDGARVVQWRREQGHQFDGVVLHGGVQPHPVPGVPGEIRGGQAHRGVAVALADVDLVPGRQGHGEAAGVVGHRGGEVAAEGVRVDSGEA